MSTTERTKGSSLSHHGFRLLGIRLRLIEFAEEKFLSLFDDKDMRTGVSIAVQVSVGGTEFSKYPPKETDVIEMPLDFIVSAEGVDNGIDRNLLSMSFLCGFTSSSTMEKAEFKRAFDEVRNDFQSLLYCSVRSQVQDIVSSTVLRQTQLPWSVSFSEKAIPAKPARKATKAKSGANPNRTAVGKLAEKSGGR
ncbi:MAG TPA: hypothetical protein VFG73_06305 [Rhodanobacteraceae bacterium]|nr:hypothetical protein [Rhodanobacteraceae bacterium]